MELTCRYYSKSCFEKPFYICDDYKCLSFCFCKDKVVFIFFLPFLIILEIVVFVIDIVLLVILVSLSEP